MAVVLDVGPNEALSPHDYSDYHTSFASIGLLRLGGEWLSGLGGWSNCVSWTTPQEKQHEEPDTFVPRMPPHIEAWATGGIQDNGTV